MKNLILIISTIVLLSCNNKKETRVEGNVFNIAENVGEDEAFTDLKVVVREYKGQVEGLGAAKIVESVYTDNNGDFTINLNTHSARNYTLSVSDDQDETINPSGYTTYHNITNIVQFNTSTYGYVQLKL
jgi:hypothetical protein